MRVSPGKRKWRTTLVLLAASSWESLARDRRVELRVRPDGGDVVLEAFVPGSQGDADRPLETGRRTGLGDLTGLIGGTYEEKEAGPGLTLRLKLPSPVRS